MRASSLTLIFAVPAALALANCKPEPEPAEPSDTETGEPSCLDSQAPGADIVLNTDADIVELQLGDCVPETIIITGGGITNLTNLGSLREVGRMEIRFCPNLVVLTGLQDLTRVDNFIITGNEVLPSLPNFNEFEQGEDMTISGNGGLADLGKFNVTNLRTLNISGNNVLTDYSGFEALETVNGNVTLSTNPLVVDFAGLENLSSIGGNLTIEDNPALESFNGLNISSVAGDVTIVTNESLSECAVMDWVLGVDIGGATIVNGNMSDLCD